MSSYVLWDRYAKVTFTLKDESQIIFERTTNESSPDFEIESDFDISESSNVCTIRIFNLPLEITKQLVVGTEVLVEAGYMNDITNKDVGTIYKGIIEKKQNSIEDGITRVFEVICNTYNDEYKDTKISLKIGRGSSASTVIKTVLSKLDKLKTGKIELKKDTIYKDGKTLNNNVKSIFRTIAKDTDSVFFIKNGVVYFQKQYDINIGEIEFDVNRFQSIAPNEDGYTLKCVFDHRMQEGINLKINEENEVQDIDIKGTFFVMKGKHVMKFNGESYTELEIKTKLEEKENEKEIEIVVGSGKQGKNSKASKVKKKKEKKSSSSKKKQSKTSGWNKLKSKYNF